MKTQKKKKLSNKYKIKIKRSYKTEYLDCKGVLGRMWLVEGASDTLIGLNTFTSKGIDIHLIHETIKLVSKNGSVIY